MFQFSCFLLVIMLSSLKMHTENSACMLFIKIDSYILELYLFKVDAFFEKQCRYVLVAEAMLNK